MVLGMFTSLRQSRVWLAALLACAGICVPAWGQRMVVVTEARNVQGESTRLMLHSADFGAGEVLPGGHVLPGTALTGPPLADAARGAVLVASGQAPHGHSLPAGQQETALGAFRIAPFDTLNGADVSTEPGWRTSLVGVMEDQETLSYLLILARSQQLPTGEGHGALEARPWPPEGTPGRVQAAGGVTVLGLVPRATFLLRTGQVLVLGASADDEPVEVQRANPARGMTETAVAIVPGDLPAIARHWAAAVLSPEETILWVLFSSLELQAEGTAPRSWLYAVDTISLTAQGPPLEISGVAASGFQPLATSLGGHCWVATRTPGTDFGQVTRVALDDAKRTSGPEQEQTWSVVGVEQSLSLRANSLSGDLLVATDSRAEYWPKGVREGAPRVFDAPITMARWTDSGPIIGEGNRVHRLALPSCAPEATLAFQNGWVSDFVEIPAANLPQPDRDADGIDDATEARQQTRADQADSDGDGIPDGSDPFPSAPSPQLKVEAEVVFPYTAVGRQLRALQIESLGAPDAQWQIDFDAEALPWLRIHPRNFRGTGQAYMGVDPERFDPAGVTSGTIQVSLTGKPKGNRPGYVAAYSPATVHVRVEAPRDPLRTILWLWPAAQGVAGFRDASDPQGLRDLGDLAAGYPYHFSHVEHFGPVSESLEGYSIVVLTARAAAEGVLTQKALFDYLSAGGAVLFLGEHLEGEHYRDLGSLLAPLGVKIAMDAPVNGTYPADTAQELLRHAGSFTIQQGCGISTSSGDGVRVPAGVGDALAFLARAHGYGRIALIASGTPLGSTALKDEERRAFALDLLYWLSRAGYAVEDRDGDGLLDATEDQNDNGAVDADETNWLDPDSDGDGIPDGLEDTNRNGVVDKGETDPRKADTDGDGVNDGADGTPVG